MPAERDGQHTANSLGVIAERLEKTRSELLAHKALLEVEGIQAITVPREASLERGVSGFASWLESLADAIHVARMGKARNGVSGTNGGSDKARKKK